MLSFRLIKNCLYSLFNKQTIGTRALVIKDHQILLIKHTYIEGWYSIGGAVDRGESPIKALKRELKEEVGVELTESPKIFNVYYSNKEKHDDYIIFYICENFTESNNQDLAEIKEKKWFDLDNLPTDVTPATKRRIDEYLNVIPLQESW